MNTGFKVKAVQLDLARHKEKGEYIREYADTAAESGFNMLVLYLEGRVRTKSFPFRRQEETYSLDEMSGIVEYAGKLGLEVLPAVSTLGHCEQFIACKELRHLAECRGGIGRFGKVHDAGTEFCPSLEGTYEFFTEYFKELSEVFTGRNFHIGLDEVWNMGFCELCRSRCESRGLGTLFTEHLGRMHKILGSLDKRIWIWDDMFEFFPDKIPEIPKDVVLCHWCYDGDIQSEGIQSHFANRFRQDWLGIYESLGLDAVICPWDRYPQNIISFTDYARRHKVLGGLLTQWEISPRLFPPAQKTIVGFAGKLWNSSTFDPMEVWKKEIQKNIQDESDHVTEAVFAACSAGLKIPSASSSSYNGFPTAEERKRQMTVKLALDTLLAYAGKTTHPVKNKNTGGFIEVICFYCRMELVHWELRELVPAITHPRRLSEDIPLLGKRMDKLKREIKELKKFWTKHLEENKEYEMSQDEDFTRNLFDCEGTIDDLGKRLSFVPCSSNWLMILRLYLQDFYSSPRLKATVISGTGGKTVVDGCFKHNEITDGRTGGHYDLFVNFELDSIPDAVRIEGGGHGGQGIAFFELQNPEMTLKPASLRLAAGLVSNAEAVLIDNSSVAFLGCSDTHSQIHNPELAMKNGTIETIISK